MKKSLEFLFFTDVSDDFYEFELINLPICIGIVRLKELFQVFLVDVNMKFLEKLFGFFETELLVTVFVGIQEQYVR